MESDEMQTLRAMAWERAKGEMQAYLHTFWPSYRRDGSEIDSGFVEADRKINDFIKDFEDNRR